MIFLFTYFVKFTGWLAYLIVFKTKVIYQNRNIQGRRIKGKAIIASNHTAVSDYILYLFVFFWRTLRYQMAEVLFKNKLLGFFLKLMGGIYVNRDNHDFSFIDKCQKILAKGGVIGAFPEGRIPKKEETPLLEFKPSISYLSLLSNTKIIPCYTNGRYFTKDRAYVVIGEPINPLDYVDEKLSEKENIDIINSVLKKHIEELREIYERNKKEKK